MIWTRLAYSAETRAASRPAASTRWACRSWRSSQRRVLTSRRVSTTPSRVSEEDRTGATVPSTAISRPPREISRNPRSRGTGAPRRIASGAGSPRSLPDSSSTSRTTVSRRWPMALAAVHPVKRFGGAVQDADPPKRIGDYNGFRHRSQRGAKPGFLLLELAFHAVFVDRHLDGGVQRSRAQRLDDVAEGIGGLGALERGPVGMRGQEHHRHVMARANLLRRGDAVALAVDANVHQNQVGAGGLLHGFFGGRDRGHHLVSQGFQARGDIVRDQPLVFHHQHLVGFRRLHASTFRETTSEIWSRLRASIPRFPGTGGPGFRRSEDPATWSCELSKSSGTPTPSSITARSTRPSRLRASIRIDPERPSGKRVLERIGNQFVEDQPDRNGLIDAQNQRTAVRAAGRPPPVRKCARDPRRRR